VVARANTTSMSEQAAADAAGQSRGAHSSAAKVVAVAPEERTTCRALTSQC
jgi:hypothetical protein